MSYLVLARKWRPRTFPELVGQDSVVRALRFALAEGRLHHAYLFSGIRGVGKTTVARILAKALNCETGVGPDPCGVCSSCQEIDGGRFADLLEVDAASRTKVDDTRELLDNVQYAPTRGRYKVYLIDEVHMLSTHSFNALLKTLEEPPPHVKFILATTDPQKLPVTVLSRCLKFPLRRLSEGQIQDHLARILGQEGLEYEEGALTPLARAADGSVRDALSLLDQAIAAGGGVVRTLAVRDMLGAVAPDLVHRIVESLSTADGGALMGLLDEAFALGVAPESLLAELLRDLHDIAVAQAVPSDALALWSREMGERLSPELVQLYYEIGCLGRRQLAVAPDPESGLRMTALRMLAFRPRDSQDDRPRSLTVPAGSVRPLGKPRPATSAPGRADVAQPTTTSVAPELSETVPGSKRPAESAVPSVSQAAATPANQEPVSPPPSLSLPSAGQQVLERLPLTGLLKHLVMNAVLERVEDRVILIIDPAAGNVLSKGHVDMLKDALCAYYKEAISLEVTVAPVTGTPTHIRREAQEAAQRQAREALASDPGIVALERTFNARVNETSVRPRNEK